MSRPSPLATDTLRSTIHCWYLEKSGANAEDLRTKSFWDGLNCEGYWYATPVNKMGKALHVFPTFRQEDQADAALKAVAKLNIDTGLRARSFDSAPFEVLELFIRAHEEQDFKKMEADLDAQIQLAEEIAAGNLQGAIKQMDELVELGEQERKEGAELLEEFQALVNVLSLEEVEEAKKQLQAALSGDLETVVGNIDALLKQLEIDASGPPDIKEEGESSSTSHRSE